MFKLKFKFKDNSGIHEKELDVGNVTGFSNSYSPSNTSASIPIQPAQNTFVMNTGVSRSFTISFTRICHNASECNDVLVEDDISNPSTLSTAWSNGFWAYIVRRFIINRWQGETDGCKLYFLSPDPTLYPSIPETNVYISDFSPKQNPGEAYTLSGTIKATVGATNISKIVASHTLAYQSNFKSQESSYAGAESNIVKVSESNKPIALEIPNAWFETAQQLGIISNINEAKKDSIWCTDPMGHSGRTFTPNAEMNLADDDALVNLYAIFKENEE